MNLDLSPELRAFEREPLPLFGGFQGRLRRVCG